MSEVPDDGELYIWLTPEEVAGIDKVSALLYTIKTADPNSKEYARAYKQLYGVKPKKQ